MTEIVQARLSVTSGWLPPPERESTEEGKAETMERPLVVFSLDGQRYALALERVERCFRAVAVTPLPQAPAIVLGIIDLGGQVVPVIDIRGRFGHPQREPRLSDHLVVARAGRRTVALLVDDTIGVIDGSTGKVVPAGEILPGLGSVDGAVKLDDGLILIHDLDRLLSLEEETAIDRALGAASCGGIPVPSRIDGIGSGAP
jgi:purine-binding chemotaxis protein CheW